MTRFDITMPSVEKLALERLRINLRQYVGPYLLQNLTLEQIEDRVLGGMIHQLKADVLAEKLPPEKVERSTAAVLEFPASSWQHFKAEHADSWWLGWLVRRWPVVVEEHWRQVTLTVDLERYRTFPQCNYVFPKDLGPYVNVAVTRDHWSFE